MTPPAPATIRGWDPVVPDPQWDVVDPDVRTAAIDAAVRTLWALSGRRFHITDLTVAPFLPPAPPSMYGRRPPGGVWLNAAAGTAVTGSCGTAGASRAVRLPGPVVAVDHVTVAGETLGADDWHLDPDGTLVRTDGSGWPIAQDVYAPVWLVRYTRGVQAPPDANIAAGAFAVEIAKAARADPACKLPSRTRDVVRQGFSASVADPTDLANDGLVGITAVDRWLRATNPDALDAAATVLAVGPAQHRHRVVEVHRGN